MSLADGGGCRVEVAQNQDLGLGELPAQLLQGYTDLQAQLFQLLEIHEQAVLFKGVLSALELHQCLYGLYLGSTVRTAQGLFILPDELHELNYAVNGLAAFLAESVHLSLVVEDISREAELLSELQQMPHGELALVEFQPRVVDLEGNVVQSLVQLLVGLAPDKEKVPELIYEDYYLRMQPFEEQKWRDK